MARIGRLHASHLALIEAFEVVRRHGLEVSEFLGVLEGAFDIDDILLMRSVASALDEHEVKTAPDAYHVLSALNRGEALHTADEELLASDYPTVRF